MKMCGIVLCVLMVNGIVHAQVLNCCNFSPPTEPYHGLSAVYFANVHFEVVLHDGVNGPCRYYKPPPAPGMPSTCAALTSVIKVWDCDACTKTDDFTSAQKSAIISEENSTFSANVVRVADPSAKQDCHGATLGLPYRVHSIVDFIHILGKVETNDWQEAEFATHGDNDIVHSSLGMQWGTIPVMGCNGQIEPATTVMFTGKLSYKSTLRMPEAELRAVYPGNIRYWKSP